VVRPSRSERKKIVSATHIGSASLELSRGTFSIAAVAMSATQIGVVVPPRYSFHSAFIGRVGMYAKRRPSGENEPARPLLGRSIGVPMTSFRPWTKNRSGSPLWLSLARCDAKITLLSLVQPTLRSIAGCQVSRVGGPPSTPTT
jgi:hypothetical protein